MLPGLIDGRIDRFTGIKTLPGFTSEDHDESDLKYAVNTQFVRSCDRSSLVKISLKRLPNLPRTPEKL